MFHGFLHTAQKMKFSIRGFFSKFEQIRRKLKTFTEEIPNGKLLFSWSDKFYLLLWFDSNVKGHTFLNKHADEKCR